MRSALNGSFQNGLLCYFSPCVSHRYLHTNAKLKIISAVDCCFNERHRSGYSVSARKMLTTAPPKFVQRLITARALLAKQHYIYPVKKLQKKVEHLNFMSRFAPNDSKLSTTFPKPLMKAYDHRMRYICKVLLSPFYSKQGFVWHLSTTYSDKYFPKEFSSRNVIITYVVSFIR